MFEYFWKIKDGLFIGKAECIDDIELMLEHKITRVINCCGHSCPNELESIGLKYLTYEWTDADRQVVLDEQDNVSDAVFKFIEVAMDKEEGVLVHSVHGQSRSYCLLAAYLMRRYRWKAAKALDFMASRRPEAQLRPVFARQLTAYEGRLAASPAPPLSEGWDSHAEGEELLLMNTYINLKAEKPAAAVESIVVRDSRARLTWSDGNSDDKSLLICQDPEPDDVAPGPVGGGKPAPCILKSASRCGNAVRISTRGGIVHCNPGDIVPKRLGLKLGCRTILLEYAVPSRGLRAHHRIGVDLCGPEVPVENGGVGAGAHASADDVVAERLRKAHAPWLSGVSAGQLASLVGRLRAAGA